MYVNKNILISCHDAGSANLIYYWMKKFDKNNFFFYNKGPGKEIFKKKNVELSKIKKLDIDLIITGTSQFSSLENKVRIIASKLNIFSITFLDHYANYKKRFYYNNRLKLPDEIWSFDIYSYKLARKIFKNVLIKKKINYFIYSLKKKIKLKKTKKNNLLYFSKPFFFKNKGKEFYYLKKFLERFKDEKNCNIKIKLHPLESSKKYDKLIKKYKQINIKVFKNSKLEHLINWCDKVFGCETYAMIIASKCDKKVYTLMYPNYCSLPKDLIKNF